MDAEITVRVLSFASAAAALGWHERSFVIDENSSVRHLLDRIEADFPTLAAGRERLSLAVNEQYATLDRVLNDADEVALIPPVSGGAPDDVSARLVREPIDANTLIQEVAHGSTGAIGVFLGVVREENNDAGQALRSLDYTAYEPMALGVMEAIAREVSERFDLKKARLVHRLGELRIGEASVGVVVSCAHRAASFDACRAMIEELKKRVPVFKREIWSDGSDRWVE